MAGQLIGASRARSHRRSARLVSEINVTPFVDVMLVLLVIFMVTAPLLTAGVDVDLPKTQAAQATGQDEPLVVSVNAQKKIYLQETELERDALIARLRGRPVGRSPDGLVLDVNGVGYLVAATPSVLSRAGAGAELTVETYLHVREDALQLYGFADAEERELFVHLLTVSGVGPKVALAVVSGSPAAELRKAIALGDHARFQAIPGIGKKTAERIVVELRDRAADLASGPAGAPGGPLPADPLSEATIALQQLGYKPAEAQKMAKAAAGEGDRAETIIRKALQSALR